LFDARIPESFFNRVGAIRWPGDAAPSSRARVRVWLFEACQRQPYVWLSPASGVPLTAGRRRGFVEVGTALMIYPGRGPAAAAALRPAPG
jgi:hypothetical protein